MASGVAKMLDESESIEDKKGQQAYFRLEEKDFWWKLTKYMMPFWRANRMLNPEVDFEFSPDFEILIQFRDPKVMMTEEQQLEVSKKRIDYGFSTLRRELDKLYPEMKDTEIDALVIEIKSERTEYYAAQVNPEAALEEAEDEESSERKHSHEGTGLAFSSSGGHYHEMSDGSGDTSITEDESPQHIHVKPDGKNTSLPRYL